MHPKRRCRYEWSEKVELFEEIRREYEYGVGTIAGVARKLGVHRRLVREAIGNAMPAPRKKTERPRVRLSAAVPLIDRILEEDRKAPRKQRHTAHRIWARIQQEVPECQVSERTVRDYVRRRKQERDSIRRETFVIQSYRWGDEAQADWYEAYACLGGEQVKLQVFCMRSMASGAAFHRAYWRATQQSFLDGHEHGFRYFGGVFRKLRYDNLSAAVKKVVRGCRREETSRFIAFRSHWRFAADFCTPAEAHEKGGVEGEIGYFRRNYWVPVPVASDLEHLNQMLAEACGTEERRTIQGRTQSIGEALLAERDHLLPLATEGWQLAEVSFPTVDSNGCIRVRTNFYSVPLAAGMRVEAKAYAAHVEVWHEQRCVARHDRCFAHQQKILLLDHYLDVLERKPGALAGSLVLEQQRQMGRWPASFDAFWKALMNRHGKQSGTRQMIELLRKAQRYRREVLEQAIERALALNCFDGAAVEHLLDAPQLSHHSEAMAIGELARYERPLPVFDHYDQLLAAGGQ